MRKVLSTLFVFGLILLFARFLRNYNSPSAIVPTFTLYAMSDYFPPEVLSSFEKIQNCKIRYDNFSNNEELLAKLQAGVTGYDVIVPSDYTARILIASHLLLELDKSLIPNLKNIAPEFTHLNYDEKGIFTVPYSWGTTGLIYNRKYVREPVDSWEILFRKEYAGHISILDDQREVFGALLKKLGYSINSSNPQEIQRAKDLLIRLKPNVRTFSSDPKQHLLSGDLWIAHIYSGDARQVININSDFTFITPKEGAVVWTDILAIPKGAKNIKLAHAFINHILETQNARITTETLYYSSPNMTIENIVEADYLKPSFIHKLPMEKLEYLDDLGPATSFWNQLWIEAKTY